MLTQAPLPIGLRAPFHELHVMTGARMLAFAGYATPV
jgi:hypothetical protein